MPSWLDVFKHLLPNARAWRITVDKTLRQFFEGLTGLPSDISDYFDQIFNDLDPQLTRELSTWEKQFALMDTGLSVQQRRDRLDATWKALGGQDPRYIQDTLQAAGFDVFVHEWWAKIVPPVLDVPLERNLSLARGTGPANFTRASTATYIDMVTGLVRTAAVDEARFEADGILIEGPGQNELLWSEEFDNAAWGKTRCSIVPDAVIGPDGQLTADKVVMDGTFDPIVAINVSIAAPFGKTFAGSIWLWTDLGQPTEASIAIIAVAPFAVVASLTIVLTTTPTRYVMVGTDTTSVGADLQFRFDPANNNNAGEYLYAFGAQLEILPFASSYMPTGAATFTRSPDVLTFPFAGNMQDISNPYTIRVEAKRLGHNTLANQTLWDMGAVGVGFVSQFAWFSGAVDALLSYFDGVNRSTTEAAPEAAHRFTQSYDGTNVAVHIDGVLKRTDPATSAFAGVYVDIFVGSDVRSAAQFFGHIKNFQIYDRNLTTAQLAQPEPLVLPTDPPIARDPFLYLDDGTSPFPFLAADGALDMQDGDATAMDGATTTPAGYPLVNKILVSSETLIGDGASLMQDGGADAQDGDAVIIYSLKQYVIPLDPTKYPFFLYIGGETFPDVAVVPQSRRDEFEDLCLKICPTEQWLGIIAIYS